MSYQVHCETCFRVFEEPTIEEAIRKVQAHEAEKTCKPPKYSAKEGRFEER